MNGFTDFMHGLDWSVLTDLLLRVIPALVCITLHELSHGYVAFRLGDPTAKEAGRLTLNPVKHIDIMGLVMMIAFRFGWAKPVPVNMFRFAHPKRDMAITAAAGPACNLLLGIVFLFLYGLLYAPLGRLGSIGGYLLEMLFLTAYISLALMIFNLIPISPLDGSKVLYSFLPNRAYVWLMRYEKYGMLLLFVLAMTHVLGGPMSAATQWVLDRLFFVARWGNDLTRGLF